MASEVSIMLWLAGKDNILKLCHSACCSSFQFSTMYGKAVHGSAKCLGASSPFLYVIIGVLVDAVMVLVSVGPLTVCLA